VLFYSTAKTGSGYDGYCFDLIHTEWVDNLYYSVAKLWSYCTNRVGNVSQQCHGIAGQTERVIAYGFGKLLCTIAQCVAGGVSMRSMLSPRLYTLCALLSLSIGH
jgi:hypothetical protein